MRVGLVYCWHRGVWWLLGQGRALSVLRTKANSWMRSCIATSDWPRAIPPFRAAHLHLVMLTSSDWSLFINYLLRHALWAQCLPKLLSVSSPLNFPSLEADWLIWQLIAASVNKKESFFLFICFERRRCFVCISCFIVAHPVTCQILQKKQNMFSNNNRQIGSFWSASTEAQRTFLEREEI